VNSRAKNHNCDRYIEEIRTTFEKEFSDCEFNFDEIKGALIEACVSVSVCTVNMRSSKLNYSAHKSDGLHVIAIGGLALSRGLTLEGLSVSYILRNSEASDTLMQMARWFGYRKNYEDICRLYICDTAVDDYEYIESAIEELRGELRQMEIRGETPEQFGLKVRRSETGIRITAANKMRHARTMQLVQSFSSKHVEGYALPFDRGTTSQNLDSVLEFTGTLGAPLVAGPIWDEQQCKDINKHLAWTGVSGELVLALLRKFQFHMAQPSLGLIDGNRSVFMDYVSERIRSELAYWDVVIPLNTGRSEFNSRPLDLEALKKLPIRGRNKGQVKQTPFGPTFKPMGDKNRISDPNEDPPMLLSALQRSRASENRSEDGSFKGDRAYCRVRTRPLLLIHLFKVDSTKCHPSIDEAGLSDCPLASLSFQMPYTEIEPTAKNYEVNPVYRRRFEEFDSQEKDDEEINDEQ
jgi:hypothetical protein